MTDQGQQVQAGGIVSVDPIVTFTLPAGLSLIPGEFPELFRNRRALHLLGTAFVGEQDGFAGLAAQVSKAEAELPGNRFLVIANDDYHAFLASRQGLPAIVGNREIMVDERAFVLEGGGSETFDAVYSPAHSSERPELATGVERLLLIGDPDTDPSATARIRGILPKARVANPAGSGFSALPPREISAWMGSAPVGLCLSGGEDATLAVMEYLLCGLMVVSTETTGGRARYLMPPYAKIVADDAEAVAAAVKEMAARPLSRGAIRDHIGRIISFERHNLLAGINRIAGEHFGTGRVLVSIEPLMQSVARRQTAAEIVAPLRAAS